MSLKVIDKLAKNITQLNLNSTEGHNIQAYLRDIDLHLEVRPYVTDRDRFIPPQIHFQSLGVKLSRLTTCSHKAKLPATM